jgi:hypothetical protein
MGQRKQGWWTKVGFCLRNGKSSGFTFIRSPDHCGKGRYGGWPKGGCVEAAVKGRMQVMVMEGPVCWLNCEYLC